MLQLPLIGILKLDASLEHVPGDVAHSDSYPFPVEILTVPGYSTSNALAGTPSVRNALINSAELLIDKGVRAITGNCGFMLYHQTYLSERLDVPVLLSSLLQLPFIQLIVPKQLDILVVSASAPSLPRALLEKVDGVDIERLVVVGLEQQPHFRDAVLFEKERIRRSLVEQELLAVITSAIKSGTFGAILLECSLLPSYAEEISRRFSIPVFDYNTMISQIGQTLVPKTYE